MVSSKCCGQTRENDSNNSKAGCTRAKTKDEKIHPGSGSAATSSFRRSTPDRTIRSKRSTSSGSTGASSPTLKGSSECGPQTRSSSVLGTRKSQRLEKITPTASPIKNSSAKAALESPLRKSERIEKRVCLTSSSPQASAKQGKKKILSSRENGKSDMSEGSVSKKRKPCDAGTFRALYTSANKKTMHHNNMQADKDGDAKVGGDATTHSDVNRIVDLCMDGSRGKDSSHTAGRSIGQGSATEQSSEDNKKGAEKVGNQDSSNNDRDLKTNNEVVSNCSDEDVRGETNSEVRCSEVLSVKEDVEMSDGIKCKFFGSSVDSSSSIPHNAFLQPSNQEQPILVSTIFPIAEVKQVCPKTDVNIASPSEDENPGKTCNVEQQRTDSNGKISESANQDGSMEICSFNTFVFKEELENVNPDRRRGEQSVTQRDDAMRSSVRDHVDISFSNEEDSRRIPISKDVAGENCGSEKPEPFSLDDKTKTNDNVCVVCKLPGKLLCCDGKDCKRIFHLFCLDPPLEEVPTGLWHCLHCVRKKLVSGVYSVCEGIEAILDINLGEPGSSITQKEKQYFVKYEGLSHVHNRWIPESQIILEAPMLFAKFQTSYQNEKKQVAHWKKEWILPHRLLGKRLIMPPKLADECFQQYDSAEPCYYEWFVKWTGLSYEQATWELENSPFFTSPESLKLIENYERYRAEAKELSGHVRANKTCETRKKPFCALSGLPDGSPDGLEPGYLNSINRLREFWHKEENAVLANEQDHIIKAILLISSLLPDVGRPFLIITTSDSLLSWETELVHLLPSVNVVIYNGSEEERKTIRKFEFYEEGGCILFRVLLSHADVIMEDFEVLDCINWEAIVVDNCHLPKVLKNLEQFKNLPADWRLVLLNGLMKDNVLQYSNLLTFLDSGRKVSCTTAAVVRTTNQASDLAVLKEQLAKYYVKERRQDAFRIVEFWVPVHLSNVQLEHYCATLDSGAMILRSSSKVDTIGALRELVLSTRKCCDHPYLIDGSLQGLLTKCVIPKEILEVGVNASGKLRLLDRILQDMLSSGLRAVVMFQFIGGEGKISIGDILDDFLRQRFGVDTYERVDSGLVNTKKQAALQNFNNKERGRFVFLIENRACLPSIKLSSVDAVIIYGSDWNPLNDIKALQKISIKSHLEQLKVFRLYSVFTVEEMVLSLAKQNTILDSNIPNITPAVSHSLLRWGAHRLFQKLDEFHKCDSHSAIFVKSVFEKPIMNGVLLELKKFLSDDYVNSNFFNCTIIPEVHSGMSYSSSISLFGEKELKLSDEDPHHVFWSKLLDGKPRQWRYLTSFSQRVRRKAQHIDEQHVPFKDDLDEAKRKARKMCDISEAVVCRQGLQSDMQETGGLGDNNITSQKHIVADTSIVTNIENVDRGGGKPRNSQKNLFLLLKPEVVTLCELLGLSEDVKRVAETLLEYVINNLHVSQDQGTLLQAVKISLCWRAASLLKCKVDHKESLLLAQRYLKYDCKEDEAESVYTKLRILKKKFSHRGDTEMNPLATHSITAKTTCSEQTATNGRPMCGVAASILPNNVGSPKKPFMIESSNENDISGHPQCKFRESTPIYQASNLESESRKANLFRGSNCGPVVKLADVSSGLLRSDCPPFFTPESNNGSVKGTEVQSSPCPSANQIPHLPSIMNTVAELEGPVPETIDLQPSNPDGIISSTLGDSSLALQATSTAPQPVEGSLTDCERLMVLETTFPAALQTNKSDIIPSSIDPNHGQLQHSVADVFPTDNMNTDGLGLSMSCSSVVPASSAADVPSIPSDENAATSDNGPSVSILPATEDAVISAIQDAVILENNGTPSARSVWSRLLQPVQVYARLPAQGLHPDPLQNELLRISKEKDSLAHLYNDLKHKLMSEYELELEKLRKKYEASLHEVELVFSEKVNALDVIYKKVDINRILAEEFRARFGENRGATARPANLQVPSQLSFRSQIHVSQDQLPQRASPVHSTISPVGISQPFTSTDVSSPSSLTGSFVNADDASTSPQTQSIVIQSASTSSSIFHQVVPHPSALFSSPPYINSTLATHGISSGHRSPAPHLHSLRPALVRVPPVAFQQSQISSLQQTPGNSGVSTSVALNVSTPGSSTRQNHPISIQVDESAVGAAEVNLPREGDDQFQTGASSLAEIGHSQIQIDTSSLQTSLPEHGQSSVRNTSDALLDNQSHLMVVNTTASPTDGLCQPPPEETM